MAQPTTAPATRPADVREPTRPRRARGARTALCGILFLCLIALGRPIIYSDGISYYALSESLARDGDFDLANQVYLNEVTHYPAVRDYRHRGGRLAPPFSGGIGLMKVPFLSPALYLHGDIGFLSAADDLGVNLQGIPLAPSLAVLIASFVYLVLGALLTFEVARRWVSDWWAVAVTAAAACSLPAVIHGTWAPGQSHVPGAFLIALALWLTAGLERRQEPSWRRLVLIGGALGLAAFVRISNGALLLPWGVYVLLARRRGTSVRTALARAAAFALGAAPFLALLLYYNAVSYGHPFTTYYHLAEGRMVTHYPFGEALGYWGRSMAYRLVHPVRGLFVWSPVTVLALVGLVWPATDRRWRRLQPLCLWGFVTVSLAMGTWMEWWGGLCAGPRFYIECFPFLAVGLAILVSRIKAPRAWIGAGIAGLTGYAVLVQSLFLIVSASPHIPRWKTRTARFGVTSWAYTPLDLLMAVRDRSPTDPRWPGTLPGRLFKGTQPTAAYLAYLWARGREHALITGLNVTPDPARRAFRLDVRLHKPVGPNTYLFVYVHDHVREKNRRGNRWGQFYSAVLPTEPAIADLTIEADVETGTLWLFGDGRAIPMPDQRPARRHGDVIARAKHLRVEVVLRNFQPAAISHRRSVVVPNPWHGREPSPTSRPPSVRSSGGGLRGVAGPSRGFGHGLRTLR